MSAHADPHETDHGPAHGAEHGATSSFHGSFKDYLVGLAFAIPLTAIPFWIVIDDVFRDRHVGAVVILIFAVVQIMIHMVYFLHMSPKSEGGWSIMALIFTSVLVVIALTGSLWIMVHLDTNMMPMSPAQMRNMPGRVRSARRMSPPAATTPRRRTWCASPCRSWSCAGRRGSCPGRRH